MKMNDDVLWTISELAAEAASVLSRESVDQASARVTEIPSTRTIRYYTTHGLLDRPADFRGRTALYNRRHLLQIVAIKRLQARGTSLQGVQANLVGSTDEELASLAGLGGSQETRNSRPESARREDFWLRAAGDEAAELAEPQEERAAGVISAVKLAGVTVLLDEAARELWEDDLEAIRVAAEPLIKLLKSRGLVRGTDRERER